MTLLDASSWLHSLAGRTGWFDDLVKVVAQDAVYLVVIVLLALYLTVDSLRPLVAAAGGAVLALVVASLIGVAWDRPRPFVAGHFTPLFAHAADSGFPSDHLCGLGGVCGGAWFASRRWAAFTAVLAVLVALARVVAGVHYVSDVVAGFVIGVACGVAVWYAAAPLTPFVDRIDRELRRSRLRPRLPARRG